MGPTPLFVKHTHTVQEGHKVKGFKLRAQAEERTKGEKREQTGSKNERRAQIEIRVV